MAMNPPPSCATSPPTGRILTGDNYYLSWFFGNLLNDYRNAGIATPPRAERQRKPWKRLIIFLMVSSEHNFQYKNYNP